MKNLIAILFFLIYAFNISISIESPEFSDNNNISESKIGNEQNQIFTYQSIKATLSLSDPLSAIDSTSPIKNKLIWEPFDTKTILVQIGGSAVGLVFGSLVSAGIASMIIQPTGGSGYAVLGLGVAGGIVIGIPAGICMSGKMMGGNGTFISTFLSSIAGLGIFALTTSKDRWEMVPFLAATNLAIPLFVYHLSASPVYSGNDNKFNKTKGFSSYNYHPFNSINVNIIEIRL